MKNLDLLKISWPTAAVIIAFIVVWAVAAYLKLPVPSWAVVLVAAVGKYLVAVVESAASNGNSAAEGSGRGSVQVTTLPTKEPPPGGPTPPMAA